VKDEMTAIEQVADRWARSERVVVLTGAGLSTASGIPDFRSPGGRWASYRPVPLPAFLASEAAREEYWRYKGETWPLILAARPNPGHLALAELARGGRLRLLVTQNVDGLHERSGFPPERLVAIHGTDSEVSCLSCGRREPRERAQAEWEETKRVPRCPCGAPWKPATISFGQSLVPDDLDRALREAAACDLFVAAGTSLVVGPINEMFTLAARGGAGTAILTASDTPFDGDADWKVSEPVEVVLPRISDQVLGKR
jgi:NAD-dependent deacetylase